MYELAEKASMRTCWEAYFLKWNVREIFKFHFPVLESPLGKKKKKKVKQEKEKRREGRRRRKTRLPAQKRVFTVTAFYKMILSYVPCL